MSDGLSMTPSPIKPIKVETGSPSSSLRLLSADCDANPSPQSLPHHQTPSSTNTLDAGSLSSSISQSPPGGSSPKLAADESDAEQTPSIDGCQECYLRLERYRAIGLSVFMISVFSFGTLTFIALPIGMFIQMMTLRKCKICRRNRREILRASRRQGISMVGQQQP